jgi:hypothetical protein
METTVVTKKRFGWKKIVGIILLVMVLIGAGLSYFIYNRMQKAKSEMAKQFITFVDKTEKDRKIPQEQMAPILELKEIVKNPDVTLWSVLMSMGIVHHCLEDGKISEQESKDILLVRDELKKNNGKEGFKDMAKFMQDNPSIKSLFESMQKK